MEPKTQIRNITPDQAIVMLEKNTMNRPVNELNLLSLSNEIAKGTFHFTGESIKFSEDGTLLDGQHRLMAIIKAGRAAKMLIITGLETDSFKFMDTGRTRQASDVLAIEGFKNPTKLAAMVKLIISFKKGVYQQSSHSKTCGTNRITNSIVSDFVNKNEKSLVDSYGYGFGKGKRLISGTI